MTQPAGGMPWRGIALLIGIFAGGYVAWGQSPATLPAPGIAGAVVVAPLPGVFTDAYGRLDWARISVMSAVVGSILSSVAWIVAPQFVARSRALRMRNVSEWREDVGSVFVPENIELRAKLLAMFPDRTAQIQEAHQIAMETRANVLAMTTALSEAKILKAVPRIEEKVELLTTSMDALTSTLREDHKIRTAERLKDREEFVRLDARVQEIHNSTYNGPDRRAAGDRRNDGA